MSKDELQTRILNTLDDTLSDFMYYDRKESEDLKIGDIEKAIVDNVITIDQLVEEFKRKLISAVVIYKHEMRKVDEKG